MDTLRNGLLTAAAFLVLALGLLLADRLDLITKDTQLQVMGVATGLLVVVGANTVPKRLKPLASETCDPARAQALRRFVGWTMTLAGLGHIAAWLTLPAGPANLAAMSIVAAALLLVTARIVRSRRTRSSA